MIVYSLSAGENPTIIQYGANEISVPNNSEFHLQYLLNNHGWADMVLAQNGQCCVTAVSYLHDSLWELLETASSLMEGSAQETVHFFGEPIALHLVLKMEEGGDLSFTGKRYEDEFKTKGDFEICFEGRCELKHYVNQVLTNCAKILEEEGEDGYLKKWERHSFPTKEYLRLRSL